MGLCASALDGSDWPSHLDFDEIIGKVHLFADLTESERRQLLWGKFKVLEFIDEGDVIVEEGEVGSEFFVIAEGKVVVSTMDPLGEEKILSVLETGSAFGEIALLEDTVRTATVKTGAEETTLLCMERKVFESIAFGAQGSSILEKLKAVAAGRLASNLKAMPFFHDVDDTSLALLGDLFEYWECPANYQICTEGTVGDTFHVIISGNAKVTTKITGEDPKTETEVVLRQLSRGDFMGEISLLNDHGNIRTATITSLQPCVLLSLSSQKFQRFLEIVPEIEINLRKVAGSRLATSLATIPFFKNLNSSQLETISELLIYETRPTGHVVFREQDEGDSFYILAKGSVSVTSSRVDEPSIPLTNLGTGSHFGEIALLSKSSKRTATVTTTASSVLLRLPKEDFTKLLDSMPELLKLLEESMNESNKRSMKRKATIEKANEEKANEEKANEEKASEEKANEEKNPVNNSFLQLTEVPQQDDTNKEQEQVQIKAPNTQIKENVVESQEVPKSQETKSLELQESEKQVVGPEKEQKKKRKKERTKIISPTRVNLKIGENIEEPEEGLGNFAPEAEESVVVA